MAMAQQLVLSENCKTFITNLVSGDHITVQQEAKSDPGEQASDSEIWTRIGYTSLYKS